MALPDVLPKYVEPCLSERANSTESVWLNRSELGEFCLSPKDSHTYPRLIAVYNGKILHVQSELLHASLAGISIKHHQGKCLQEKDDESQIYQDNPETEMDDFDLVDDKSDKTLSTSKNRLNVSLASATENESSEFLEEIQVEGQPLCTLPNINVKVIFYKLHILHSVLPRAQWKLLGNSFWNIHRPELCKLTWGQKYVSKTTVIEHLHEHLTLHGELCRDFHTEEDRTFMLNKELDEYVRLKVLAHPRNLPPDEPPFDIKYEISKLKINPKCKRILPELKIPTQLSDRVLQIDDDDDDADNVKSIHISKEEFCLTIGKHVRGRTMFVTSDVSVVPESFITPQLSAQVEEAYDNFYFDWFPQNAEENEDIFDKTVSSTFSTSESLTPVEPKPRFIEDEFCRAAGKVDFSDLRCNPDF